MKRGNVLESIILPFVILLTPLFASLPVYAANGEASIGISPSSLKYSRFLPGMTYEQKFTILGIDPSEETKAFIIIDAGEINDWFSFSPGDEIIIPKGAQKAIFTLRMTIPKDAELKDYDAKFRVKLGDPTSVSQVAIVIGVRVDLNFAVSNEELNEWEIRMVSIADFEEGDDMILTAKINNKGNVSARPSKITVAVEDLNGNIVKTVESTKIEEVAEYVMSDVEIRYDGSGIVPGDYFGNVTAYDGDSEVYKDKVVFRVLESTKTSFADTALGKFITSTGGLVLLGGGAVLFILFLLARRRKDKDNE